MTEPNYQPDWNFSDELNSDPAEKDKLAETRQAHCPKCGDPVKGDEDGLCWRCAGD